MDWLFILQSKGDSHMKWTKHAGLVSCNFEARLINKLNKELSSAKQHKKRKAKEFKNKHGTYYKRTT
mgnify:FL=1